VPLLHDRWNYSNAVLDERALCWSTAHAKGHDAYAKQRSHKV
jgi:hypothetical protein